MTKEIQSMYIMLDLWLKVNCPVLSGNMKAHIKTTKITDNEIVIEIKAPFYNLNHFRKTNTIKYTRKNINGFKSYAYWVNQVGAFGRHNQSEHWVNRACFGSAVAIANQIGAIVTNTLPQ